MLSYVLRTSADECTPTGFAYVSECGPPGHDGGLVDVLGSFGVEGHQGVASLVVSRDPATLVIYLGALPLRTCQGGRARAGRDDGQRPMMILQDWSACPDLLM